MGNRPRLEPTIRLATPDDAPLLRHGLAPMRLAERERAIGAQAWVAWTGSTPLGGITTVPDGEAAVIPSLWVEPGFRGQGVGRALLARAVADLRARGFTRVTLHTNTESMAARSLYESAGWVITEMSGRVVGYELDLR